MRNEPLIEFETHMLSSRVRGPWLMPRSRTALRVTAAGRARIMEALLRATSNPAWAESLADVVQQALEREG